MNQNAFGMNQTASSMKKNDVGMKTYGYSSMNQNDVGMNQSRLLLA